MLPRSRIKPIQRVRFLIQAVFFTLAIFTVWRFWGAAGSHQVCPLAIIETPILAAHHSILPDFFTIGIGIGAFFILTSAVLSRVFCGWVCPVGFVSRILHWPGRLIGIRVRVPVGLNNNLGWIAFVVLFYVAAGTAINGRLWCIGGCPLFWQSAMWKMPVPLITIILLAIFVAGSVAIERFFCRWFCPYGAILGLIGRFSIFAIRRDVSRCTSCHECDICSMGTLPQNTALVRGSMCISCLRCTETCPEGNLRLGLRRK